MPEEFEALCATIEAPLFSYALRLTGNAAEAEELAQDALVRVFHALYQGRLRQNPRAYAFTTAHHLAMDRHRARAAAHKLVTLPPDDANIVQLHPQQTPSPAQSSERALLRKEIDKALEALPQDQRAALLLREFGDLSYQEISDTLKVPLAQVKIWIYRGRKKLAQLLDRDGQYIGNSHHGT